MCARAAAPPGAPKIKKCIGPGRMYIWTDDAYVMVHYASIAPRIAGRVVTVPVDDNQVVKAGQALVTLDPRDYEQAVATAEATLAKDSAQLAETSATLERQPPLKVSRKPP
jgi:membrane fusion protein (multidrug efflux system)